MQDTIKVSAANLSDVFILQRSVTGSLEPVKGVDYRFLEILSQALRFSYEIVSPQDNEWGVKNPDGSWTGMIGMLQKQEADLAIGFLVMTEARQSVVDFSIPYTLDKITFAIQSSELSSKTFVFVKPFQLWVWMLLFIFLLFCSGVITFIMNCSSKSSGIKHWAVPKYFCLMKVLLNGEVGRHKIFTWTSTRLVVSSWNVARLVLVLSYMCVLLSFLMIPLKEPQIRTFLDLTEAVRKGKAKVAVPVGSSILKMILEGTDETARVLGDYLRQNQNAVVPSQNTISAWVLRNYAFLEVDVVMKMNIHENGLMEEIFLSPDSMQTTPIGIAFRKGFCCTKDFNRMILRINEAGIFNKILDDHIFHLELKAPDSKVHETIRPIAVEDFLGLFWILIACYVSAIIVLLFEIAKAKKLKFCSFKKTTCRKL